MPAPRKLNVFISYATPDVETVRALYQRLAAETWITPWFDRENLLPGMDWQLEIDKALRAAEAIILCLSTKSVGKEGYVQKELKRALDIAEEKPDGTIYILPLRLDDCEVPLRLRKWQWVDDFAADAHARLLKSLQLRAEGLGIAVDTSKNPAAAPKPAPDDLDLYQFVKINSSAIREPFLIGKYPVTNAQYSRFLQTGDFARPWFWTEFPKYDENHQLIGNWGDEGLKWLREKLEEYEYFPPEMWKMEPEDWQDENFGLAQPNNPVVGITWYEANAYCRWLSAHWFELPEWKSIEPFRYLPQTGNFPLALDFRLPLETEWVAAAGGNRPEGRYPWNLPGKATTNQNEIIHLANVSENGVGHTTAVNQYPEGRSPFGILDMAGNIWEWQANLRSMKNNMLALRGGSWYETWVRARVSGRNYYFPNGSNNTIGFRVAVVLPPPS